MSNQSGAPGSDPAKAPPPLKFSRAAGTYYWSIVSAATIALVVTLPLAHVNADRAETFALLVVGASLAQLFIVEKPGASQSYRATIVFLAAAALLLPPGLALLVGCLHYVPSWIRRRKPWRIQTFNLAKAVLTILAAWASFHGIADHTSLGGDNRLALGGVAACLVFVLLDHVALANIIVLTSSRSFFRTGLFGYESLSTDVGLFALGVGVAAFWHTNRWMTLFVLAPLVIIHRAMHVPQLEEEAKVDAKTGLFNAREFAATLQTEVARARRFGRPLALMMADLDFLRTINNTHGHLAGDAVLIGIADIFRESVREYDVPSRFGGEEFSVLLPETTTEEALEIAERIRAAVEARAFLVSTSEEPIRATVSIGIAGLPQDAVDATSLIHAADVAVYAAKGGGRNRVERFTAAAAAAQAEDRRSEVDESPLAQSLRALEGAPAGV